MTGDNRLMLPCLRVSGLGGQDARAPRQDPAGRTALSRFSFSTAPGFVCAYGPVPIIVHLVMAKADPPRPQYAPLRQRQRTRYAVGGAATELKQESIWKRRMGKPGATDWYFFALELKTMINAGMTLLSALELLIRTSDKYRMRVMAERLRVRVSSGENLTTAVEQDEELPPLVKALITMGNRTGQLTEMLELVARHYTMLRDIRGQILRITIYPVALTIMGTCVLILRDTILYVVQQHMQTARALGLATFRYGGPVLCGLCAGAALALLIKRVGGSVTAGKILLTVPLVGSLQRQYSIAVFCDVAASAIDAGMPITPSYELAANSMPNKALGEKLLETTHFLRDGEPLSEALRQTGIFPQSALGMVVSGEAVAEQPYLMRRLATYYYDEIQVTVKMTLRALAPVMVCVIAIAYFGNSNILGYLAAFLAFLLLLV